MQQNNQVLCITFKICFMKLIPVFLIFMCSILLTFAQEKQPQKLKVFLDCNPVCDENFIKTEITVVDFVLDRLAADVHLLITSQVNGSGGNSFQLIFFGQNSFKNRLNDSLLFSLSANVTSVETRLETVKRIKLGLIPFIINTPYVNSIEINMQDIKNDVDNSSSTLITKDKWNYWVYKIGIDGEFNEDEVYRNEKQSGNISVNRTTPSLRVNFLLNGNYSNSRYEYDSSASILNYKVVNSNYEMSHYLVESLGRNWSYRYELSYSNSTFSNIKNKLYFGTGIEYAIIPYSQSNNKFFAINYNLDISRYNYFETTIYDKTSETLLGQKIQADLSLKQKWGYITSRITYHNFFNDWKLNNLSADLNINLRVTGGLFFYVYFNGAVEHDQIYLEKGDASIEEILTKRKQLQSSYKIYSGIGLSYRFGSILNNFVNPRFSNY